VRTGEHPFQYTESAPVTQPKDLKNNELLIQVHVCGLNPFDGKMAETNFVQVHLPSTVGYDISGKIHAARPKVKHFQISDEVFGCSNRKVGGGGYQEYCVVPEDSGFIKKPGQVSHEQAGSLGVAFLSALDGLKHVKDQMKGKSVFIPGASGSKYIKRYCIL
jgi:NADPH:quinone reductase-like Zn-dependent oxidoreductase